MESILTVAVALWLAVPWMCTNADPSYAQCDLRVLVLRVPEKNGIDAYWTAEEAQRFNNVTRWLLDLFGMTYDEMDPEQLTRDALYQDGKLRYSVVVDNGNRLQFLGKDGILMEAVMNDGLGLVLHTISCSYASQALGIIERPLAGWKDKTVYGELSIDDDLHYITRTLYAPVEHVTHNLAGQIRTPESFVHGVEVVNPDDQKFVLATTVQSGWGPPTGPEIIARDYGEGRIVWFARPFYAYLKASYFFVESDYSLAFLLGRAVEWASNGGVMVSKWLYPRGNWFAYALIMDGYYDYPPPGYTVPTHPPESLSDLVDRYFVVEDVARDMALRYTAAVVFRNNATRGWDAGYNLTYWGVGKEALRTRVEEGNELALGAFDFINYDKLAKNPASRAKALSNLRAGREAMRSVLGVEDPAYVFSFVPELVTTGDDLYRLAFDAGFDIIVGGIYKTHFPYDLYGSIYPYYLKNAYQEVDGRLQPQAVVVENNFYFDGITEATDLYYWQYVYRLHGALVTRVAPWQIYNSTKALSMLKGHLTEIQRNYEDVWWTTVGELGRYALDRSMVDVSATSYGSGAGIQVRVRNNGDRRIDGFTVKVRLEDNVRKESMLEPMEVISVKMDGRELEERANWALKDIVATRHAGALLVWTDLEPGQEAFLEVSTSAKPQVIPEHLSLPALLTTVVLLFYLTRHTHPAKPAPGQTWTVVCRKRIVHLKSQSSDSE